MVVDDVANGAAVGHVAVVVAIVDGEEDAHTGLVVGGDMALDIAEARGGEGAEGTGGSIEVFLGCHCG